jgi:hypothetical protein
MRKGTPNSYCVGYLKFWLGLESLDSVVVGD